MKMFKTIFALCTIMFVMQASAQDMMKEKTVMVGGAAMYPSKDAKRRRRRTT